jgi:Cu(I)/Ag(I) efflux system membrane fusion protein
MKVLSSLLLTALLCGVGFQASPWFKQRPAEGRTPVTSRHALYYACSMHPAYHSDQAGDCMACGMRLEPVYPDIAAVRQPSQSKTLPPGTVHLSPDRQQLIGVKTALATRATGTRTLRTTGRVAVADVGVYHLSAGVDGVIQHFTPLAAGSHVTKGQLLATYSGPDARPAIQSFLVTLDMLDRQKLAGPQTPAQVQVADESYRLGADRLLNAGMSQTQIEEIRRTRSTPVEIKVLSPIDGIVLARYIAPGQRFDRGMELYRIADLSHVWIMADVFQSEVKYFKSGRTVRISLPNQGQTVRALVSDVVPQYEDATRTLKVRLEVNNPSLALTPGMFVDVETPVHLPSALTVPGTAVLDSGLKKTLFVARGNGYFEPRRVETDWRTEERVAITQGLKAGERVVVSGNFLLDSESQLRQGVQSLAADPMPRTAALNGKKVGKRVQ